MPRDEIELEALRALGGPQRATPAQAEQAARAMLAQEVAAERAHERPSRRRRLGRGRRARRRIALALAGTVVVGVATAAAYVELKPQEVSVGVLCADEIDPLPGGTVVSADGRPYAVQCAEVFGASADARSGGATRLTACDSGRGGVFVYRAGSGVCERLGLTRADDAPSADDRRFIEMRDRTVARVSARCLALAEGKAVVEEELARAGLERWSVRSAGEPSAARPCTSLAFDSGERVVSLVPIERP